MTVGTVGGAKQAGAAPQRAGPRTAAPQSGFAPWKDPSKSPIVRFENVTKKFDDFVAVKNVTLDIYDAAGSHVATLLAGRVEAGEHRVSWSTEGVPAGGYLWRLRGSRWSRGGMVVVR